ncbi:MAG: hypothetical protein GY798_19530 [Hyphomicrobiales bacterium]|nr:hypothetical protein [Hyphomicrobiales bacterium]
MKVGAAKKDAGRVFGLVAVRLPRKNQAVTPETFSYSLRKVHRTTYQAFAGKKARR